MLELVPALGAREPNSAYMFYDCQTETSGSCSPCSAKPSASAPCSSTTPRSRPCSRRGRANGVTCIDADSEDKFEIRADNVVNATGVWADRLRDEVVEEEDVPRISPSRGTHVTLSLEDLPVTQAACIVPAGEERTIFALPWYGNALVGTTDNDYEGDIARVEPSGSDIEYLLDAINSYFELELGAAI